MTVEMLERAATALGPLLDEVVFVGGATIALWITDPAAPAPRPTDDVDVIVEVTSRSALHDFEQGMRDRGFREDIYGGVICRWRHGDRSRAEDLILGDHLASRDLEDIVLLIDGRDELLAEIADAPADVRTYIASEIGDRLSETRFIDAVYGLLRPDDASQARAERLVLPRLRALAAK